MKKLFLLVPTVILIAAGCSQQVAQQPSQNLTNSSNSVASKKSPTTSSTLEVLISEDGVVLNPPAGFEEQAALTSENLASFIRFSDGVVIQIDSRHETETSKKNYNVQTDCEEGLNKIDSTPIENGKSTTAICKGTIDNSEGKKGDYYYLYALIPASKDGFPSGLQLDMILPLTQADLNKDLPVFKKFVSSIVAKPPVTTTEAQAVQLVTNLPEVQTFIKTVKAEKRSKPIVASAGLNTDDPQNPYWSIQVYEDFSDHTATFSWYRVYKNTGEVDGEIFDNQTGD